MLIGIDATALYGRYGGVEYALWNLLDAMRHEPSTHRFHVWIPRDGPPMRLLKRFPVSWNFERLFFDGAHKARRIAWQQTELPRAITRARVDVLHAPTYVCPLLSPVPVALTVYDLFALSNDGFATRANRLHYGALLSLSIRRAARVLVPSEAVRDDILRARYTFGSRVEVVPLGVEPLFFGPHAPESVRQTCARHGLTQDFILWAGNFEPKKNGPVLLRATELLREKLSRDAPHLPLPTLALAGGARAWRGWELSGATVARLGYVPRRELPLLLGGARAFAFPSLAEGFGLPALEALASGTPLVVSDRVPLPRLRDVALVCDARDPSAFATGLFRVLTEPELARSLGSRGQNYARDFSWSRAAQATLRAYERAVL